MDHEEAAEALAPYLGTRLSAASFSAIERSVDVGRCREFSANELLAFARAFRVPITWFFTPPSPAWDGVGISTPDAAEEGLDPMLMLDAVLGTPETLEDYKSYLFSWPDPRAPLARLRPGRRPQAVAGARSRHDQSVHRVQRPSGPVP